MEKFYSVIRALITVLTTLLGFGYIQAPIEYTLSLLNFVFENADSFYGAVQTLWVILGTLYSLFFDPKRAVNKFQLSTLRWTDRNVGYKISQYNPSQYKTLSL